MRSESHPTSPSHAFSEDFLAAFSRRGEVASAPEAELAGPWTVRAASGGWGVFRQPVLEGDVPEGLFEHREHALLLASVLGAVGREPLFHIDPSDRPEGYAVETVWGDAWVRTVGRMRRFQPEVIEALHVAESLLRSPAALASLLEAAGATALDLAGRILSRRLEEEAI